MQSDRLYYGIDGLVIKISTARLKEGSVWGGHAFRRFLPRDATQRALCRHAVSIRPSVTPFQFFHTKRHDNIPTGNTPLTGASNAGGVGTNCDRRRYSWSSIYD